MGWNLLDQLELILEHDKLIDEVGFVHPAQFAALDEGSNSSPDIILTSRTGDSNSVQYDKTVFWYSNHKLAISVQVLPQLYHAAVQAYMSVRGSYKQIIGSSSNINSSDNASDRADFKHILEMDILKHTRSLLILSYDFNSAWNSRKLVLSRKHDLSFFMEELQLCALILSYAPKSESSWRHRRWVIKMIAENFQNLQEIIEEESQLVKNIAEKSKMNYRAWNNRCWLVCYMTRSQVLDELKKSKKWAELHVADNCCFHYRRRLILRMLEGNFVEQHEESSVSYDVYTVWKEELQWNELLIKRYMGREALWVHRRFLSHCWIKHFATIRQELIPHLEAENGINSGLNDFLGEELQLLHACLNTPADGFDDSPAQAQYAASYILYISKQIHLLGEYKLQERLKEAGDLKALLRKTCPEKLLLWESLLD